MVMTLCTGMGDSVLRDRLPALWRRIENAHYSYLEIDDSPEKLQQKKKLEGYILEYLTLVPHECKFGLAETGKVFQRTVNELDDYSAYRAGIGWAAIARYASNLLSQPWRKEYQVIRTYSGYFKHDVEANLCGAESILQVLGYKPIGGGRLALDGPVCPDMAAAVSRDAIIAHCECQIMVQIWESVLNNGGQATWSDVARDRVKHASAVAFAVARLSGYISEAEIYTNVPASSDPQRRISDAQYLQCSCPDQVLEEPVQPIINPYMMPNMLPPHMMYPIQQINNEIPATIPQCHPVTMMTPYGPVPYYYPVQAPYMIPTPVYAPIKQASTVPVNGFPISQYRYPTVPTGQLIELDGPSVYENGKFDRPTSDRTYRRNKFEATKRSTSKSGFSDMSIPSLSRSDTQPSLTKAKEDGMGTYESWDYVFRNLSSKEHEGDAKSGFSQSLDRDSRTLDRLDREDKRSKYQPTTLDLEDGLQALNLDRSYDEDVYRTAKVNENLMRLKQEQEIKKARQLAKRQTDERKSKKTVEHVGHPKADGLVTPKVAPDKVKLLTKKEVKDRKDVMKQQTSVNGSVASAVELKKVKKSTKLVAGDTERPKSISENGMNRNSSGNLGSTTGQLQQPNQSNYDLNAQLIVSLDEPDSRRSPPKHVQQNGDRERCSSRTSQHERQEIDARNKWQCGTCTYLNKGGLVCEICGKSKKGPEIEPLTSGGRECPACTLVNKRDARACDACGTSLQHCPTYI